MKFLLQTFVLVVCCAPAVPALAQPDDDIVAGPLFADFPLTLSLGHRFEAVGPLYYSQKSGTQRQWALPPFFCHTSTPDVDWTEMEILYPFISYRRFGGESWLQILEVINFAGGRTTNENNAQRFTIFPLYFQQRSPDKNLDYTAVVPFYGELKNRLFRDQINFVLFPLYSETRKKDVVTDNYLYPIFDLRRGNHLHGWQMWPLVGVEHKAPTFWTNTLDETVTNGGYDKLFAAWPIFFKDRSGLGTTNASHSLTIVPFYSEMRSASRDQTSYGWPLGYNIIDDRENKYVEHDYVWPLVVMAHGSKNETRIFPIYSRARNASLESDFYLWPIYKFNKLESPPLERRRTRILFFLYSDTTEINASTGSKFHRNDFWPFYTYHRDVDGNRRWQALALLEPFFPNNRSIGREYSQVWSLWRWEKNPKTHATSQSLLWNLYRRDQAPGSKKLSLLFGLFQYQSGAEGRLWRVCYVTVKKKAANVAAPKS